jgi:hypothetical protein
VAANSDSEEDSIFAVDESSTLESESTTPDLLTLSESSDNDEVTPFPNNDDRFSEISDDAMMWDDPDWTTVESITDPDISKNETATEVHDGQQRNRLTV